MKLHLNLTLRRAVLAAMALVAVHTTQAQDIVIESIGSSTSTLTGDIIWTEIVNFGNSTRKEDCTLQDGTFHATNSIYIGGKGYGTNATYGNNGTLTVDATATLSATNSINVGNTEVTQENGEGIVGTLIVDGGKVTSQEITVGVNKGSGYIEVSGGGKISATDALKMGYYNSDISGSNYISIDGAGSSLTVGEAGGNNDFTSIGAYTNGGISIGNGASATFYDQTIIGENANSYGYVTVTNQGVLPGADPEATASSTLTLGTKTILGLNAGAEGFIYVEGSKLTGTEMVIGSAGIGALHGMGNSTIELKTLFLGQSEGSEGTLSLETGDKLTVQTDLTIGNKGTGNAYLTEDATLDVAKNIHIGYKSSGTLTAEGATAITAGGDVILGGGKGGNGTLWVGKGSEAKIAGNLSVGYDGTGTVTNDGTITAKNATIYGADSSITNSGDLTTGDTIIYLGFLDNSGNTTIGGKLEVSGGTVTNTGTMNAGDTKLTNTALTTGVGSNTTINGKLEVDGGTVTNDDTLTAGNTSLTNATLITGVGSTTDIKGNLGIFGGTTTLSGRTTVTGDTAITALGTLTTTAGSELAIGGGMLLMDSTATIGGSLSVGNTSIINSTLSTSEDTVINGTLTATESTVMIDGSLTANDTKITGSTLSTIEGDTTINGSLTATESNVMIDGALNISGDTTLADTIQVSAESATIGGKLDITNTAVMISNALQVTGDTSFSNSSLSATDATFGGSLNISDESTVTIDGSLTANDTKITGSTLSTNEGDTTINGSLTATESTVMIDGALNISGDTTLADNIQVSAESATIGGKLDITNTAVMIDNALQVTGDTTFSKSTLTTQAATLNGALNISDKSTLTLSGNLTAGDTTIADSELSTIGGNATIDGSLDITNSTFNIDGSIKAGSTSLTSAYLSSLSDTTIDSTLDITNSGVSVGGNLTAGDTTLSGENSSLSTAIGSTNTIDKLTINAGYVEINGSTTAGDTKLAGTSSMLYIYTGSLTTATTVNQGTINNAGTWTIGGETTSTQGAITNTGSMKVADKLYSNTITGTGTISVADKAAWYMYGNTEQTTVDNAGNIYVGYNGHLKADSLTGTGTTTIQVNNAIASTTAGSAVIALTNPIPETDPETDLKVDPIKVEINLAHAASLVGKTVNFLSVGGALVGLGQDNITSTEATGWTEDWKTDGSKSYYSIVSGDTVTKLEFTASTGSAENLTTITGMTFNRFAESQKVDMNLTVPGTYQLTEIEVTTEIKVAKESTVTGVDPTVPEPIVSAGDAVQAITITKTKDDVTSDGNKKEVSVVFSKNVETTTGTAPTVKTTAITQNTTTKDADGNVTGNDSQLLDVSGLTMVFDGTSSHKGNGNGTSKAEMGFKGNPDKTELGEVTIDGVTAKLEQVDIIEVKADSNVEVKDVDMASTHALTIEKGSVVTFDNVDIQIGGATDTSIVQTVNVIQYNEDGTVKTDDNGKPITEEHVMESASHLTTSTVIESATIKLLGNTKLTFEEIQFDDKGEVDPDLHGTTTITGSTVEISGTAALGANSTEATGNEAAKNMQTISITDNSEVTITGEGTLTNATLDGGSLLLVQNEAAGVENVVVSNGSHLKGKGKLKKVHVDKDSTFTVGSSPGQFTAADLTVDGVTNFYFITDSKEWDSKKPEEFTGTEATDYDLANGTGNWGAISQLWVDGPVSLNGEVRFTYQKWDPTTQSFVNLTAEETQAAREELGEYFTEGTSVKFVVGNTDQLTLGNGFWINEDTLPVLADGLEWDVTSLFSSEHTATVTYAMIGDPNRIANTLLSAGSTVLDFGRLGEAQAILREKGTTRTWGSAIANFDSIDSKDGATGYDYNAWGGAVGVDHAFTDRTVVGIALGRTYGENEAKEGMGNYEGGSIDQDATMVGLYGTHKFKTKGIMNDVKFKGFAAYGWFENESTRDSLKNNRTAEASWDSNAWVLSASLSRDITTDNDIVCSTYVGVEYTKATMDDFEESNGKSTASYTADEDYSNLAVKVGMTVSKSFGGFTPYVGIAYIHDVKRDVPEVTASNGRRSITGEGCMPGRGAVQIKAGANWQLSETLDIFAGYSAEIRDNATEHNANLGMGLTF